MTQQLNGYASIHDQRIRNYLRVVHERFYHDVEELTREVNFIIMNQLEWEDALKNVDNPAISPPRRAARFHRLIEQGTQDALHGDPGEWQAFSGEDHRAREAIQLTAPERIARVVQRMRVEFPHLVAEFA